MGRYTMGPGLTDSFYVARSIHGGLFLQYILESHYELVINRDDSKSPFCMLYIQSITHTVSSKIIANEHVNTPFFFNFLDGVCDEKYSR